MGIQSIVLENHRYISVLGSYVVTEPVAYIQLALRDILEAGDHTQSRGLTATGGTYQDYEFLIFNLKIKVSNSNNIAIIDFVNVLQ